MDTELTSVRPTSNEADTYPVLDGMEKPTDQDFIFMDPIDESLDTINTTPETGFCAFIQSRQMRLCQLVIFGLACMIAGILVIYYTTLPSNEPCQRIFRRTFKSSVTFGSQPQSVAIADLNNDNQTDIVVLQIGINSFGVFFSNSTKGTFSEQEIYSTRDNSLPSSIAIGDMNGDKYKDLIISKYGANSLTIYLNNQGKTFIETKNISLGSSRPIFVRTGYLNNDNELDIVVINYGTNTIGIILSKGNFSFEDMKVYSTGYDSNSVSLAIGDLNNDKFMDIVVCNSGTDNIGIFYGMENGLFQNQIIYSTEHQSQPTSVDIVDFNNDNYLDIIVSNNGTNNLGIFLNDRNGSFESQIKYSYLTPTYTQSLIHGDMNNDGHVDILLVDQINDQFHVLLGNGNGSIFLQTTYDGVQGSKPYSIAIDKFNDNNRLDIVLTNFGTNEIMILEDYSYSRSTRNKDYLDGKATYTASFLLDDFNGDELVDIVSYSDKDLFILFGQSDGTFNNKRLFSIGTKSNIQSIAYADLNHDNQSDIVISDIIADRIIIFLGDGNGNFNLFQSYSTGDESDPYSIVIKDINQDGNVDLIIANHGISTISILFGFGNGSFTNENGFFIGDNLSPTVIVVEDFNKDTNDDLIVLLSYGHFIIYLGNGDGTFNYFSAYESLNEADSKSMVVYDYNGDGYLDLFITDPIPSLIRVYAGGAEVTFFNTLTIALGAQTQPYSIFIVDMNEDGYVDAVISLYGSNTVLVYFGNQQGTFRSPKGYSTGESTQPFGVSAYDLKHDGKMEIIVALLGQGSILVFSEYNNAAFDNIIHYSTGSSPQSYSVNIADLNENNQIDIVVANTGLDQLEILFDFDTNIDENKYIYSLDRSSSPRHIITCDFNQDGHTDLVNVNTNLHSISLIKGYGNGTFGEQIKYPTNFGSYPYFITAKDLNNDSRIDFVVANKGSDNIGIYYGFNYNSFQNQVIYQPADTLSNPAGLTLNYFNNDKYLDIIAILPRTANLGILLGNGDGTFSNMTICFLFTDTGVSPSSIVSNDLNNDSYADLVVADTNLNAIYILFGDGTGSFQLAFTYSTGDNSYPASININHLNDDSLLDIVVVNSNTNNILIFFANIDGDYVASESYSTGDQSSSSFVQTVDLDNDNLIDIIVSNTDVNNIGIFYGLGGGKYEEQRIFPTGDYTLPSGTAIGDFNLDNQMDIATINWNSHNVGILFGLQNKTFSSPIFFSTTQSSLPSSIQSHDMNKDGYVDLIVSLYGSSNVVILYGLGDGTFLLGKTYSTGIDTGLWTLNVADFNNDTYFDIAVVNSNTQNIGILISDDFELFGSLTTHSTEEDSQPYSIAIADCNNDHRMDIIVTRYGLDSIGIFLANQYNQYDEMINYSTGSNSAPYGITTADVNRDENIDIIVTNSGTNEILIFLGIGNGSFVEKFRQSTGDYSNPYSIAVSDFNNDTMLDISIANYGASNILILYGLGNGSFINQTSYGFGYQYNPVSVVVSDLNNDKWMDMVIAASGTDHIETMMKIC